jgi:hypothetical protein
MIQPGQSTTIVSEFTMHAGMGGQHLFDLTVKSNDPAQPEKHLYIASFWQ